MLVKPQRIKDRAFLDSFYEMSCIVCNKKGCDPAHIKSKGSGGDDSYENVIPLCRMCHTTQHSLGHKYMYDTFYSYKLALRVRGWVVTDEGKLRRK